MGAHDFKYNKVPLLHEKQEISILVIPQCMCQVSLGLKEVQMGAHDFENKKVPLFGRKTRKINTSMSAAPELALVPASRYYCDVTW